jgi:hypothetical protein
MTLPDGSAYEAGDILLPNFVGQSLRDIRAMETRLGVRVVAVGNGRAVAQHPPAGVSVAAGSEVRVRLSLQ